MVSGGLGALVANSVGPTVLGNRGVGRIAYVPGAAGGGVADGSTHTGPEDLANMRRYVGFAPDDMTHVFNMAGIYELPFGKGKKWANTNKWANAFFGGWKITQNWNFQTGVPMFFSGPCTGAYSTMTCRPNVVGDLSAGRSSKTKQQLQQQWYNPAALCAAFGCDLDLSYSPLERRSRVPEQRGLFLATRQRRHEAPFRPRSGLLERRYVPGKDLPLLGVEVSQFPLERVQRLQPPEPGNSQLQLLSAAGTKRRDGLCPTVRLLVRPDYQCADGSARHGVFFEIPVLRFLVGVQVGEGK